ncbi:hypothetical protein [Castellaniella sp.]|uniref:hypothetical protein n=1 Tax=Castellaniella sp. TaxID=1955812 RepID=UPI002AFE6C97|nr:hypothetical protein [Castellaniella sp.]
MRQFIDFRPGYQPRIRYTREGFDASDYSLGNEVVTFDSEWPEILTVHDGSWSAGFTLQTNNGTIRDRYRNLSSALPFAPLAMAWRRAASGVVSWYAQISGNNWGLLGSDAGGPAYRAVPCYTDTDRITVRDLNAYSGTDYAYLVLANTRMAYDTREDTLGSMPRIWCGNHPTHGMGLFVARRGANVMTCPAYDLRINTTRPSLQIAASGNYTATQRVVNKSGTTQYWGMCDYVDLAEPCPDRPPVLVSYYTSGLRPDDTSFSRVLWLSDTRFIIYIGEWQNRDSAISANVRWWVPRYRPGYVAVDTVSVMRVRGSADGLEITEADVDVRDATAAQRLFDSNRCMLHIYHRASSNGVGAGALPYSSKATGPPLVIVDHYFAGGNVMAIGQGGIAGGAAVYTTGAGSVGYTNSPGAFRANVIDFSKYI